MNLSSPENSVQDASTTSVRFVVWHISNCLLLAAVATLLPTVGYSHENTSSTSHPEKPANASESIDFTSQVLPILSKLGCNSGACHGALAGKGGFRLSLNAYDPSGDHFNIVQQSLGRRVEIADPGRSLLLTKPTGLLPHKGGLKLDPESVEFELLAKWIAEGAHGPSKDDGALSRIEVLPKTSSLQVGDTQQLTVNAIYEDGRTNDVTRWAKFTSTFAPVLSVDESGRAKVTGQGEAAVVVWFSSQLAVATVTSPFDFEINDQVYDEFPKRNFIDELVIAKLKSLRLEPSPRCDDATFVRRAFIDTIGMLPTIEETKAFLLDNSTDKRDRLIEALLERDEFVDYWTYRWSDVFLVSGKRLRPKAVKSYYQWIRDNIESNTPWDKVVRQVVTAQGSSYENGATNFYALHQSPEEMAENVSQAFLGLSINCARCHNHPLEKWTNDQYYAMANLFSRVRAKGWGGDTRNGDGLRTVFVADSGELVQPLTGKPQPPTPLDGVALAFDDPSDRREHLAKWLTSPDNPYFSRSVVNRVWANFMGRGLVENVDDMRISNPASNEPLLAALSNHVVENDFDLKSLMRLILQSEVYQRSSEANDRNRPDDRFYSRYLSRRMMAEVLLDSISQVTEVPSEFKEIEVGGADRQKTKEYPVGTRAIELYDSAVSSRFLSTFGRNKREIVCDCERSNKPSMVQVLHISNGDTINEKLKAKQSCVGKLFLEPEVESVDLENVIDSAYLATFSRFPNDAEKQSLIAEFDSVGSDEIRSAVEDLYWSLMSTREFLFQH